MFFAGKSEFEPGSVMACQQRSLDRFLSTEFGARSSDQQLSGGQAWRAPGRVPRACGFRGDRSALARQCKSWLAGFLLYVAYVGRINPVWGTKGNVHCIVCSDADRLKQIMQQMATMPVERVRNTSHQILRDIDATEEARNILSNIMKVTEAWSFGKAMGELSRGHDIDFSRFHRETQSLYWWCRRRSCRSTLACCA